MAAEEKPRKKRGPKGGMKHQPGRGHNRKSIRAKKKRFVRKADRKRKEEEAAARQAWEDWDRLSEDVKGLLGPAGRPKMPRPRDEQ
jgi:hypothetical protein